MTNYPQKNIINVVKGRKSKERCIMKIYKVVPCPGQIVAKNETLVEKSIANFSNLIMQESVNGWTLVSSMPIEVLKRSSAKSGVSYNALVFVREEHKEHSKPEAND